MSDIDTKLKSICDLMASLESGLIVVRSFLTLKNQTSAFIIYDEKLKHIIEQQLHIFVIIKERIDLFPSNTYSSNFIKDTLQKRFDEYKEWFYSYINRNELNSDCHKMLSKLENRDHEPNMIYIKRAV